jgi:hypothetical protein
LEVYVSGITRYMLMAATEMEDAIDERCAGNHGGRRSQDRTDSIGMQQATAIKNVPNCDGKSDGDMGIVDTRITRR